MIAFLHDNRTDAAHLIRHSRRARRLRLAVPALQGDRHLARRYEQIAHAWPGIVAASADPRSGRMLLEYAPGAPLLCDLDERNAPPPPRSTFAPRVVQVRDRWHTRPVEEIVAQLATAPDGLTVREAARRLRLYGHNLAEPPDPRSRLGILAAQLTNAPMAMLLGSAGVSLLLADLVESSAILVVVGLNAGIGYHIEHRNQQVLTSWRKLEAGLAQVVRGGALQHLPATELVPGDVILVRAGDILPADARVIDAHRLSADEAPLTGESEPQHKQPDPVPPDAALAERTSMLYAGTSLVGGHGRAIVVATGSATEVAHVRALVEAAAAPPPPLAERMQRLGRRVAAISVGAAGVATAASVLHGKPTRQVLKGAVALAVAALPEGLPLVATSALVRSMQRLHEQGMVVRRVAAAEALGGVTVICADKTGTLTCNDMRLEILEAAGRSYPREVLSADRARLFVDPVTTALAAGLLNSDVDVLAGGRAAHLAISGSATERALVDAAHAAGLDGAELRRSFPRLHLYERRQGVHYVRSVHRTPEGGHVAFVKGAPEQVLALCTSSPAARRAILARNDALAAAGLRVLGFGWRPLDDRSEEPTGGFNFLGLAALRDPLREGAAEAIERARAAGIRTVILTGDQRRTAAAVARELGLKGETLVAADVVGLSPDALTRRLAATAVLARVTPEDKLAIVRALRASGEVVAMAGDGINDAPALKAADVGIAVGASATDLARQVADVVMAGEDLRSILAAVGEGRVVQDNLRRALRFLFATNLSEMALVLGAAITGARDPLTPMQLLWINLLTDTLPGLALALEPGEPDVLDRPPAPPGDDLLAAPELQRVGRDALLLAGVGAAGLAIGGPTLAFSTLTAAQLSYAGICRAPQRLHGEERRAADRRFAALLGGGAGLQFLALTLPPLRALLGIKGRTPLVLGGFFTGLALPWAFSRKSAMHVVTRRGSPQRTESLA